METPAEVDYLGGQPPLAIRDSIQAHVAALEKRFGRITACRVAIKQPTGHHRTGGLYEVNVHLALPNGRDVNIDKVAQNDERLADASFAVNHAFKRARRVLQDRVRRMQGRVKTHEPEPLGTIARIDETGEFGFIETSDGREVYFHRNSILNGAMTDLEAGTRVAFFEEQGEKGPQASTVKLTGKHGLR